ncbi:hypothetical protein [Streptomyces anulatus]|uniref:hypothetical protein n=1 Tax=Streptomyces anulatus TaxID=1892 RepID=UPI003410F0C3
MDAVQLAQEVTPYVAAAISTYGVAVLTRVEEVAADTTVALGQRLLARLTGRGNVTGQASNDEGNLIESVTQLAEDPDDFDLLAVLRLQIRRVLLNDPDLALEVEGMVSAVRAGSDHIEFHAPIFGPVQGKGIQNNNFGGGV